MDGAPRPWSDLLALVGELEEELATRSLANEPIEKIVENCCRRARDGGLSVARVLVTWRLLNPLFFSQTLIWRPGEPVTVERFRYAESMASPEWIRSPMRHVLDNRLDFFRAPICRLSAPREFPVLDDFAAEGMTDYVSFLVGFGAVRDTKAVGAGILLTVCSDREGGFRDEEIEALGRLKFMLAVAIRSSFQAEIAETLAATYLGRSAGRQVLSGQITRGGGEEIRAVIWYCDLRNSTELCERMGVERYIPFLNDYFTAAAGPVAEAGGDILDFIGDAVLAVFPLHNGGLHQALDATRAALAALRRFQLANCEVIGECGALADLAGIAIDTGRVVYGNIGTEDRLTFSVIGPTVNRVTRIERLTKTLHEPVLATRAIAAAEPGAWQSRGAFYLDGVAEPQELFALTGGEAAALARAGAQAASA